MTTPPLRPLLAGMAAMMLTMGIGRFAYTPLLPPMQNDVGFGAVAAGDIAAINYAGYLLGAVIAMAVPPTAMKAALFRGGLVFSVVTTAAMGITESLAVWGVLRFLGGLASALGLVLGAGLLVQSALAAGRRPALGLNFAGVGLGIALSGVLTGWLEPHLGWRGLWLLFGGLAGVLAVPGFLWLAPRRKGADPAPGKPTESGAPARLLLALLALAYFCEGLGYVVSATFLVAIFKAAPALAPVADLAWIVVGLAAAPSCLLWARLAGRIGEVWGLALAHLVQALGIALPVLVGGPAAALAGAVLFGGTFLGIVTMIMALGGRISARRPAFAMGLLTSAFGVGQIVGPALAGRMAAQAGSFDPALLAAAGVVMVGAGFLVLALPLASARGR